MHVSIEYPVLPEGEHMEKSKICKNAGMLLARLAYARASMNIHKSIQEGFKAPEKEVLEAAYMFWVVTMDNCIFRALMELAKAYEDRQHNIGLKKLINQVEQAKLGDDVMELVRDARTKYNEISDIREKLCALRDHGLAHADKYYLTNPGKLLSNFHLKLNEIETLLNTAMDICNSFLDKLTGIENAFISGLNDDASGIIQELIYAKTEREKQGCI